MKELLAAMINLTKGQEAIRAQDVADRKAHKDQIDRQLALAEDAANRAQVKFEETLDKATVALEAKEATNIEEKFMRQAAVDLLASASAAPTAGATIRAKGASGSSLLLAVTPAGDKLSMPSRLFLVNILRHFKV